MILPEPQRVLPVILHPEIHRMVMASRVRIVHLHGRSYGQLSEGDMLYVREGLTLPKKQPGGDMLRVVYGNDGAEALVRWPRAIAAPSVAHVPPAGMPMQVSRLTLVVTEVARMRIQQIDPDEAIAAGVKWEHTGGYSNPLGMAAPVDSAVEAFGRLWDAANSYDLRVGWAANPEVTQCRVRAIARNVCDLVPGLGTGGAR
jgi:hypothetical protein